MLSPLMALASPVVVAGSPAAGVVVPFAFAIAFVSLAGVAGVVAGGVAGGGVVSAGGLAAVVSAFSALRLQPATKPQAITSAAASGAVRVVRKSMLMGLSSADHGCLPWVSFLLLVSLPAVVPVVGSMPSDPVVLGMAELAPVAAPLVGSMPSEPVVLGMAELSPVMAVPPGLLVELGAGMVVELGGATVPAAG